MSDIGLIVLLLAIVIALTGVSRTELSDEEVAALLNRGEGPTDVERE